MLYAFSFVFNYIFYFFSKDILKTLINKKDYSHIEQYFQNFRKAQKVIKIKQFWVERHKISLFKCNVK